MICSAFFYLQEQQRKRSNTFPMVGAFLNTATEKPAEILTMNFHPWADCN